MSQRKSTAAARGEEQPYHRQPTILISETNPIYREILGEAIRERFFARALLATDASVAQSSLSRPNSELSLIICDSIAPKTIGGSLFEEFEARAPQGTAFILFTDEEPTLSAAHLLIEVRKPEFEKLWYAINALGTVRRRSA